MERDFLDAVKEAWDSADVAPGPQPPSLRSSEDSGPWPLALYPILGESSRHRGDYDGRLLASPPWRLPSVYQQYKALTEAQGTLEGSATWPSPGLWPAGTQKTPETPAGETETAHQTAFRQLRVTQTPDAGARPGVRPQDAGTWDSAPSSERRLPPVARGRGQRRVFWGHLQWIRDTVYTFICGCCRTVLGAEEP